MRFQVTTADDPGGIAHLRELVGRSRPRCGEVVVVAVDGPSGSGKTTLADALAQELGCPVLHMDDLFPGWDGLAPAAALLTDQVLLPLSRGLDGSYRAWDWAADAWGSQVALGWVPLLIVEGCAASVRPAGDHAAVRIWVEADPDVRMARGLARDGEAYRPHWERWAAQEAALFAADATRERADVIVRTSG